MIRALTYTALLVGIGGGSTNHGSHARAEVDPIEEARGPATAELRRLSREGWGSLAAPAFNRAHLDDPHLYYGTNATVFRNYEHARPRDILLYMTGHEVVFPVLRSDSLLGLIRVKRPEDNPFAFFSPVEPDLVARIREFTVKAALQKGQRMSIISTALGGVHFAVEDGAVVYRMAPASRQTTNALGLPGIDLGSVAFAPTEEYFDAITRQIRTARGPSEGEVDAFRLTSGSAVPESARAMARMELETRGIPGPGLDSLDVAGATLGEPFLDVTLRGAGPEAYLDAKESDPRLFASVVLYCFPIYVPNHTQPVGAVIIVRNRDESGEMFSPDLGEVAPWGYYMGNEGRVGDAVRLRERFNAEVSFVEFLDTHIPSRIIIADSAGLRSGPNPDALKPIVDDARDIRSHSKH